MKKLLLSALALLLGATTLQAQSAKTSGPAARDTTQSRRISGRVLDKTTKEGLPGVTVIVKGTTNGTSTNAEGHYTLLVPRDQPVTLQFKYLGYVTLERIAGAGNWVDVSLSPDTKSLQEVVVTARPGVLGTLRGKVLGVHISSKAKLANRNQPAPAPSMAYDTEGSSTVLSYPAQPEAGAGDTYATIQENKFLAAAREPLSTFALDVDGASYSNLRRFLNEGQLPPRDAVRVEEMLNYFSYHYPAPAPTESAPVRISTELTQCPWNAGHQLARIGVQARRVETAALPPATLVFLVDVSGSMMEGDRLPLVQSALKMLVKQLRPQDHVALVAYAGAAGLVLPPTPGNQPEVIRAAIDRLEGGGSTAGGAGLRLAYATARQSFKPNGNNRIILATDGDFNVGESSEAAMEQLITEQRESGVFLSVLGVGRGNLRDSRMELLADKGNGNYAYLDNIDEARRVLVAQFGGTLFTVAQDVKLQVEFNPARVRHYRLVGYENRALAAEDFNNDRKDAGELGAGHTVTALYEIETTDSPSPLVDALKYQPQTRFPAGAAGELLTVKLRYKEPRGSSSKLLSQPLAGSALPLAQASADTRFAAAVAEFGLLLRQSEQRGTATYAQAISLAEGARADDPDGYRAELVRLLRVAEGLTPASSPLVGSR